MKTKAVIFDLDGTLYDNSKLPFLVVLNDCSHIELLRAERRCRREMAGLYFPDSAFDELFRRMAAHTGKSAEELSSWYNEVYLPLQARLLRRSFHVKPWVRDTLETLGRAGIRTACFSDYGYVEEKLSALTLSSSMFDCVSDALSEGGCKPCREAFLKVAQKLGTSPEDIVVAGDREDTDGAGAVNAGMRFLKIPRMDTNTIELCL